MPSIQEYRAMILDIQRQWPRRQWRLARREARRTLAVVRYRLWLAAYDLAAWAERAARRLVGCCNRGMGRAYHVLRPWDVWGARDNFEAQRAYDYVAAHPIKRKTLVPPEGVELKSAELGLMSESGPMEIWHAKR